MVDKHESYDCLMRLEWERKTNKKHGMEYEITVVGRLVVFQLQRIGKFDRSGRF